MNEQAVTESNESTDQAEIQEAEQTTEKTESAESRPEWLDEKFESGEQLQHSYNQLQQKFHERRDNLRNELINELNEESQEGVPESAGDYRIHASAFGMEDLEGVDEETIQAVKDDPQVNWLMEKAHQFGLTNDEFNTVIAEFREMDQTKGPDWNEESKILGEHADSRLERIAAWAEASLPEDAYNVFASIPASAGMVHLFENLMELNGQPKFNMVSETQFQERVSKEDLNAAMKDERYWKNGGDPAYIAKVRAMSREVAREKAQ